MSFDTYDIIGLVILAVVVGMLLAICLEKWLDRHYKCDLDSSDVSLGGGFVDGESIARIQENNPHIWGEHKGEDMGRTELPRRVYSERDEQDRLDRERKRREELAKMDEDDSFARSSSNMTRNIVMGDMLGLGIPGGIDGDMGTLL